MSGVGVSSFEDKDEDTAKPAPARMDTARLRAHVFEQTGIRIDTADPVFALVALNDAVLAEGVERQRAVLDELAERLAGQTDELLEAGERFKRQAQRSGGREAGGKDAGETVVKVERRPLTHLLGLGAGVALVSAALTITGMNLFGKKDVVHVPVAGGPAVEASPLTAEQILHLQNGEKFVKIMPKLDAKTQARILELMREP